MEHSKRKRGLFKKAIAVILGITMAFGALMLPESVVKDELTAASAYIKAKGEKFTVEANGCTFTYSFEQINGFEILTIRSVESHGDTVEFPSVITHDGRECTVLAIGNEILANDKTVKTVIFPETVKYMGDSVLSRSSVESIVMPSDVEEIGTYLAGNCPDLKKVEYNGNSLNGRRFGEHAFENCEKLVNPIGAICMGNWLIRCKPMTTTTQLKVTDLSNTERMIDSIAASALVGNKSITQLDLSGIKFIGGYNFSAFTALETVVNTDSVEYASGFSESPWYKNAREKGLVRLGDCLMYYKTDSNSIDLTSGDFAGVKTVCRNAFKDCINAETFKCTSDCMFEGSCFYESYKQNGKNESIADPIPKTPTYKIKTIYLDGKELKFSKSEPEMPQWINENYSILLGTAWLKNTVEDKARVLFDQMSIPFYGFDNDKTGTLSKTDEFYAVMKIHDYISTYGYDINSHCALTDFLCGNDLKCDTYAKLHDVLLECAGVRSVYLSNGTDHAWNEVQIGDEWFETDDGWNAQSGHGYGWFALSTAEIQRRDSTFHVPDATGDWHYRTKPVHATAERTLADINGDGDRTEEDSEQIWAYIKGESDTIDKKAADVNFDGKIDLTDAVLVDQFIYSKAVYPYDVPNDGLAPGFKVYYIDGDKYGTMSYTFTDRDGYLTLTEHSYTPPEGMILSYDIGNIGDTVKIKNPCTVIHTKWIDPNSQEYEPGDVNGDGAIDIEDAVAIIQHINGATPLDEEQELRADVSKDSNIDIDDAVMIISYINGNSTF